eukprot:TRINITY_DN4372_c1_g1_i1.p1 TRINITY_DN4372_c1_g1~~TRINITY_DN4372_c1_g1_i1.p1  ORF type:complete len:215 (+),score=72.36 TRINITY_DN4372_c1_g1_i1:60-704(+)
MSSTHRMLELNDSHDGVMSELPQATPCNETRWGESTLNTDTRPLPGGHTPDIYREGDSVVCSEYGMQYLARGTPGGARSPAAAKHRTPLRPLPSAREKEVGLAGTFGGVFGDRDAEKLAYAYNEEHRALLKTQATKRYRYEYPFEHRYHWGSNIAVPATDMKKVPVPSHTASNQARRDRDVQRKREKDMAARLRNVTDPMQPLVPKIGRKLPWG